MASTIVVKISRKLHRLRRMFLPIERFIVRTFFRDWIYRKFIRNILCRPTVKHIRRCVHLSRWKMRTVIYDFKAKRKDERDSKELVKIVRAPK